MQQNKIKIFKKSRISIFFLIISVVFLCSCSTILLSHNKFLKPKLVVLTFDDGPNDTYKTTERLLNVLDRHAVKAHFCLIGSNVMVNPELTKAIYSKSHSIVNHGFDGKTILFKSANIVESENNEWNVLLKRVLNDSTFKPSLYRPSYGIYNSSFKKVLRKDSLSLLPVSFYVCDAQKGPRSEHDILKKTLENINARKSAVIVFHDGKDRNYKLKKEISKNDNGPYNRSWVPDVVDSLITILENEGFRFVLYDSLIKNK